MVSSSTPLVTGDGRTITVDKVVKLYRAGLNVASPSSGRIKQLDENNYSITGVFNTLDCDTLETIKTSKIYSVTTKESATTDQPPSCAIDSVRAVSNHQSPDLNTVTSNNNRFLARLKSPTNGKDSTGGNKKQLLEIWDGTKHVKTIDVSESDAHGPINVDPQFSSFQWCPFGEQDKLLYICQRKQPKCINFFKAEKAKAGVDDEVEGATKSPALERGREFDQKGSWGECLAEIEHTLVAILDVSNDCQINTIDMDGFSLAGSRWLDNGNKIVSVAYPEEPRRLGLIYCNNRPSEIVVHDLTESPPKQVIELISEVNCFHTPRVDHSGQRFVYLTNKFYGAHVHAVHMYLYDLRTHEKRLLLDKLDNSHDLFIDYLPNNCFSANDQQILFENSTQLVAGTYILDLNTLKCSLLGNNLTIYDFNHNIVLFSRSNVDEFPCIGVCVVDEHSQESRAPKFHYLEEVVKIKDIQFEMNLNMKSSSGSLIGSSLYAWPNLDSVRTKADSGESLSLNELPTIVLVHGGPHSAFASRYMPTLVFYARLGLKTLLINYRGSTGLTEEFTQSLCGEIGNMDVSDCLAFVRHYVEGKKIDPSKLIIQGGSHGGFLSCHLSCQDEFKFTSAVIRNPVVSIASMQEVNDIPDWCYTEILNHKHYDFGWAPNEQDLVQMYKRSPIAHYEKAKVPTLMMLGTKDLRVPMYQGLRWVELLKARGVDTKCKVYPDKHDLARPEVAADSSIESVVWMLQHLPSRDTN